MAISLFDTAKSALDKAAAKLSGYGNSGQSAATPDPSAAPDPRFLVTIYQPRLEKSGVRSAREATSVVAYLPENIQIDTTADYDTPYAEGFIDNGKISALLQAFQIAPTVQAMSTKFWKGSSPLTLSLPLVFAAESSNQDVLAPVMKLKGLCMPRLMDASGNTGILEAPGPRMSINTEEATKLLQGIKNAGSTVAAVGMSFVSDGTTDKAKQTATEVGDSKIAAAQQKLANAGSEVAVAANRLVTVEGKISVAIGRFFYLDDVVIENVSEQYDMVLDPSGVPIRVTVNVTLSTRMNPIFDDLPRMYPLYQGGSSKV
jgi:hypothetical protein